jgi:hypothetical protein
MSEMDFDSMFRLFIESIDAGVPIPPVPPQDLKYFWKRICDIERFAPPREGEMRAIGMGAFGDDNPFKKLGETATAVWFRCGVLHALLQEGILKEWQHGEELDDLVFSVAASIPLGGAKSKEQSINPDEFVARLREKK